ncbi:MAG TPA: phage tail tape measure protein [Acidimicrobiia bacterium]
MAAPGRNFVINLIGNSAPAEKAFRDVGRAAGRLPGPVGIATAAITASFVAVVAVVGKVTKELFDLGQEFDDVYDNIRIQTGMTGEALGALQDSFRTLAAQVPNDFGDIGIAVQDLNTRLGLSGEPLEDLALQLLTVTRLMGGDVQTNVRTATRLFGDFGVAAEDQSETLDMLFRASQASGQSFDTLADQTVNYGADLRALGFSLPQAVSALALFERTGVNTETVMSGLRLAVSNLAKEGEDIPTAFEGAIQSIRDAETEAEAFGIAVELVGTRYASNFLDTIRGGKFDLDEFVAQITEGNETIGQAAEDTDGFRESWDRFKNYIKLTLEPVAEEVFTNMEGLIGELQPAVDRVKEAFEEDGLEGALAQVAEEWDRIYKDEIEPLWIRFLAFLNETVKPIALELGSQIGSAIASGMWNAFKSGVSNLFGPKFGERVLEDLGADGEFQLSPAPSFDFGNILPSLQFDPIGSQPPSSTPAPRVTPSSNPGGSGGTRRRSIPSSLNTGAYDADPFMFAVGGFVSGPTLGMVGEAGPEVVMPLDWFESRYGGGGGNTINVTVTSADPEAVVEAIRRYTRNNGPLGQVVSL